jgi:hypothetical protein
MALGRPTLYNDSFCQKLIDHFKEGGSVEEFCLDNNISKQTFYNWCEVHEDFFDAKKIGESFSQGWWMKKGRLSLENKDFSYTGWYMNMKNRFGWKDKADFTTDGEKLQSNENIINISYSLKKKGEKK